LIDFETNISVEGIKLVLLRHFIIKVPVPNQKSEFVCNGASILPACAQEIYPDMLRKFYRLKVDSTGAQSANISRIIFESFEDVCR
jgi:hypothetical protein